MNQQGGALILARQNTSNYTVIFVALILIVILVIVYLLMKWINSVHSSPQWIEMHRSLPTTSKNIANISKVAGLDKEEKKLLEQICHLFRVPNIEFLVRDEKAIDELFRGVYQSLCERTNTEQQKTTMFTLRYKLEKAHNNTLIITSTKSIVPGQTFVFTDVRGTLWTFTLAENNAQGLFISLPPAFVSSNMKPDELSKFDLNFTSKTGIAYNTTVRIIRYEQAKDGGTLMLIGHTNSLKAMQRRAAKRVPVNRTCVFSAVEVSNKSVDKTKSLVFKPMENKYDGQMQDISANGCRLLCTLPIKQGQYIYVEFDVDDNSKTKENAIGLIVNTTQTADTTHFILHIQFVKIAPEVRNRIYAFIYNYA